jgi:hypothetical protein
MLADNRLAENAGWDREILAIELQNLIDLDFDVEVIGFETAEIDLLLEDAAATQDRPAENDEEVVPPEPGPTVTQLGDLWILGDHRLLCGNALDPHCYARLLEGEKAQFVFTDPPYNVPVDRHVCGKGSIRHREFAMASGESRQSSSLLSISRRPRRSA